MVADSSEQWLKEAITNDHINYCEFNKFTFIKIIGKGGFGSVARYKWKDAEFDVALKCLNVDKELSGKIIRDFIKELKLLRKVAGHKNVITFHGITKDKNGYYNMILDCANEGNLREYLKKNFSKLKWIHQLCIAKDIVHGLMFLHEKEIAHRDLHSKNILIDNGRPLIADFGLSKQLNETLMTSNSTVYGMPAYIEPQCFLVKNYRRNIKSDIYSFGVILWEISSGKPPFELNSIEYITGQIILGKRERPKNGTPSKYIELYNKCWDTHPQQRPKAESVFKTLSKFIDELSGGSYSTNRSELPVVSFSSNKFNIPSNEINGEGSSKRKNKGTQNNQTSNSSTASNYSSETNQINGLINGIKPLAPLSLYDNKNNGYTNGLAFSFDEQSYKTVPPQIYNNKSSLIKDTIITPKIKITSQNIRANSLDNNLIGKNDELEKIIRENNSPTLDIGIHKIAIGITEAKLLANTLRRNPSLVSLNLSSTKLNNEGAKILLEALRINTTLASLDISINKLSSEGGKSLEDALSKNKALTSLNLFNNSLGSEGGKALANALCVNTKLKTLILENNNLCREGGVALANALTKNNTLEVLDVGSNNIGPEGAKEFCEALNKNKTLKTLTIENNNLGREGGVALANALIKNNILEVLNVGSNNICPEGVKAFCDALNKNKSLNTLTLENNNLGPEGGMELAKLLTNRTALITLNVKGNNFGKPTNKLLNEKITKYIKISIK